MQDAKRFIQITIIDNKEKGDYVLWKEKDIQ